MSDKPLLDYEKSLENLLKFVTDQSKNHPDEEQRKLAGDVFADFFLAAILDVAGRRQSGEERSHDSE